MSYFFSSLLVDGLELEDAWTYARRQVLPYLLKVLEENDECRRLFGGGTDDWDPSDVLRSLILIGGSERYGSLQFDYLPANLFGQPIAGRTEPADLFRKGNITIDIGSFLNYHAIPQLQLRYSAATVLHELGHLYNFAILGGSGGFAISNFQEVLDPEAFDKVIRDKCGLY